MKKFLFLGVFVTFAISIFAESEFLDEAVFNSRDESMSLLLYRVDRNSGASMNDAMEKAIKEYDGVWMRITTLSILQEYAISTMLNRFRHTRGDSYLIVASMWNRSGKEMTASIMIAVEYTSQTEYRWWATRMTAIK